MNPLHFYNISGRAPKYLRAQLQRSLHKCYVRVRECAGSGDGDEGDSDAGPRGSLCEHLGTRHAVKRGTWPEPPGRKGGLGRGWVSSGTLRYNCSVIPRPGRPCSQAGLVERRFCKGRAGRAGSEERAELSGQPPFLPELRPADPGGCSKRVSSPPAAAAESGPARGSGHRTPAELCRSDECADGAKVGVYKSIKVDVHVTSLGWPLRPSLRV